MREIKFRGKCLDNGEWIYGYYGHKETSDQHFIMVETMNSHHDWTYFTDYEVDPKTVGQYTGLKDKNGRGIYEGDIVLVGNHKQPAIVEYDEGYFYTPIGISRYRLGWWQIDVIEVIGNIYENPELLDTEGFK